METTVPPQPAEWIRREVDALVAELPENVEARVREAGFIIPDAKPYPPLPWHEPTILPIRYRTGPLIPLPPLGDGD